MGVRIVHATSDENGRYSGGKAGDQNGKELTERNWYNRPWDYVARPTYSYVAQSIANIASLLAANPNIGYDQKQRTTLYKACEKIDWNLSKLSQLEPCECDCSSLIAVILRFIGIEIPETVWTGNLDYYLAKTGYFTLIFNKEVITADKYIRAGDILVNRLHHAAVAVSSGTGATVDVWYEGRVNVSDYLQVRTTPEVLKDNEYMIGNVSFRLPRDMRVIICEQYGKWGRIHNINGWVHLGYIISEGTT